MTTFGERVAAFRKTAKGGRSMGRLEFGALAGLTPTKIRNIETGREPTDAEIDALIKAFPALGATVFEQPTSDPAAERPQLSIVPPVTEPGEPAAVPSAGQVPDDAEEHDDTAAATVDLETIETVNGEGEDDSTELEPVATAAPSAPVTPAVNFDDGARRFSNSEIQTFKRCKRKWWLAWYRRLKLKVEDPTGPRAIGDRVHRALMAWYAPDGQERTDPRDALERVIVEDWTKIVASAEERGYALEETDIPARFEQDTSLERRMVAGYVEWLAEEGPDQGLRVVGAEMYVEADVAEAMKLIGKIDARVVRDLDGAQLFIDHKTVPDLTGPVKTLHMDEQLLFYHVIQFQNAIKRAQAQLDRQTDVSGAQPTTAVAMPLLSTTDHSGDRSSFVGGASPRPQSSEQQPIQPGASSLGLPQQASQYGSEATDVGRTPQGAERSGQATRSGDAQAVGGHQSQDLGGYQSTVGRSGAASGPQSSDQSWQEEGRAAGVIYNMLRKVKRTGNANPPFYGRVEVHHNDIELTNFLISTYGTIEDILSTAAKLDAGADHHRAAYASRRKECAWDCDFFPICPMFDDGSRVEAAIEQYYVAGDPLAHYGEKVPT